MRNRTLIGVSAGVLVGAAFFTIVAVIVVPRTLPNSLTL